MWEKDKEVQNEFKRLLELNKVTNPNELIQLSWKVHGMYSRYCLRLEKRNGICEEFYYYPIKDYDKIKRRLRKEESRNAFDMLRFHCEVLRDYVRSRWEDKKYPFVSRYRGEFDGTTVVNGEWADGSWLHYKRIEHYRDGWGNVWLTMRTMYEDVQFKYFWLDDLDSYRHYELRERDQKEIEEIEAEFAMIEAIELITSEGKELKK